MASGPRFVDQVPVLIEQVGPGKLEGRIVVDQIYAAYQHEHMGLRHPGGGGPKYLERALHGNAYWAMLLMRDAVLTGGLRESMVRAMETIARKSADNAPFEFGDLKASHAIRVKDAGRMYRVIPANRKRLTKAERRIKSHVRNLGLGNR